MLDLIQKSLGMKSVTPELLWLGVRKSLHQNLRLDTPTERCILPIFGCQRSGTSLMTRVFFRDVNAKVYRESSPLSGRDRVEKLRLDPYPDVLSKIDESNAPLVVLKPLVESQNALSILDASPIVRGLWMFRHYRDVALSNERAFGSSGGIADLRPFVNDDEANWRSQGSSDSTRSVIKRYFSEEMSPLDAGALFWYARNQLFFEQRLENNERIFLCDYDHFVQHPSGVMRKIYGFVSLPYPGDHIVVEVHSDSISKGGDIHLSPEIGELCEDLLYRLRSTCE